MGKAATLIAELERELRPEEQNGHDGRAIRDRRKPQRRPQERPRPRYTQD